MSDGKYLIVWDDHTGYQGLSNVEVILADTAAEAKDRAGKYAGYGEPKVYDLDKLPLELPASDHWSYYR